MSGSHQKHSIIGNPHHIRSTTVLRTVETGRTPFTQQNTRRRSTCRMQDISGLGHPNLLYMSITLQRKRNSLGTWYQGIHIFGKHKYRKSGIIHRKYKSLCTHHSPRRVLPDYTTPTFASKSCDSDMYRVLGQRTIKDIPNVQLVQ